MKCTSHLSLNLELEMELAQIPEEFRRSRDSDAICGKGMNVCGVEKRPMVVLYNPTVVRR